MKRARLSGAEGGSSSSDTLHLTVDSDEEDCGLPVSRAEAEEKLCQQRRAPCSKVPSRTLPRTEAGAPLLQSHQTAPSDECYAEEEVALSEYQKLHSICATEATSSSTLQLLSDLVGRQCVKARDLEKIPKTHDDLFLREANKAVGERACVCGKRCLGRIIALMRHGKDSKCGFTCVEFLSPKQLEIFKSGGGLPARRGKCLLCTRYFTAYVYQLARLDPQFMMNAAKFDLQLFENCVARVPEAPEDLERDARSVPHATSVVSNAGGYRPDVCLFVDESFVDTAAGRGDLATLAWRPVVRFRSLDYKYTKDTEGNPIIVQVRMGVDHDNIGGHSHFHRPPVVSSQSTGGASKAANARA